MAGLTGYKKIGKGLGVPTLTPAQERARRSVSEFRKLLPTLTAYARNLTGKKDVRVEMDAHSNGHTDGKIIYFRPPLALGDVESMRHDKSVCDKRDPKTFQLLCAACDVREDILATVYHEISHIAFDTFLQVGSDDVTGALEKIEQTAPEWYYRQVFDRYKKGQWAGVDSFLKLAAIVNPYFKALVNGLEDVRINERMALARPGTRIMQTAKTFKVALEGVEQKRDGRTVHIMWPEYEPNLQASIGLFCLASGYPIKGWFDDRIERALLDRTVAGLCKDVPELKSAQKVFERSFEIFLRMRELGFFITKDEELPPPPPEPEPESQPEESKSDDRDGDGSDSDSSDSGDEGAEESESDSGGTAGGEDDASDGSDPEGSTSDSGDDEGADSEDRPDEGAGDAGPQDSGPDADGEEGSGDSAGDDGADGDTDRSESSESGGPDSVSEDATSSDSPTGEEDGGVEEEGTEGSDESDPSGDPSADSGSGSGPDGGSGEAGEPTSDGESDDSEGDGGDLADPPDGSTGSGDLGGERESSSEVGSQPDEGDGSQHSHPRESEDSSSDGTDPGSDEETEGDGSEGGGEGEAEASDSDGSDASDESDQSTDGDGAGSGEPSESEHESADGTESGGSESDPSEVREDGDRGTDPDSREESGSDDGSEEYIEPLDYRPDDERDGTQGEPDPIVAPTVNSDEKIELVDLGLHSELDAPDGEVEQEIENAIVQGVYFTKPSSHVGGLRVWKYDERDADAIARPWHAWGGTYYDGFYGEQSNAQIDPVGETHLGPALMKLRIAFADNKRSHRNRNQRAGRIDGRTLGKRGWGDDDRLFGRKVLPKKKDYFVCIGLDVSGSTRGVNIKMIKEAALAQAELCQRLGVKFAVYAHTGGPLDMERLDARYVDMYEIKAPDQAWDNKSRNALIEIGPSAANLDGHTLEFYRKVCDREQATNKVILYYSDGAMPLENYNEELEILQSEIQVCKQKRYTLLGVGVRTDSPTRHGLDTVQIDDSSQVGKVVIHLERALLP